LNELKGFCEAKEIFNGLTAVAITFVHAVSVATDDEK